MGQEHEFPDELLPSNMFTLKRSPILWIGSGISKRYAVGSRHGTSFLEVLQNASV